MSGLFVYNIYFLQYIVYKNHYWLSFCSQDYLDSDTVSPLTTVLLTVLICQPFSVRFKQLL